MSEGISLGVPHQMLISEYSPKHSDEDQALEDITATLESDVEVGEGNENLIMLAAHAPESIPTDLELEVLLKRIQDTVLQAMVSHGVSSATAVDADEALVNIGLEDYKEVMVAIKNRIVQFLRWAVRQATAMYKRLSDRLGRLSLRVMYVERKIDSSGDNAIPSDTIKLPQTANLISLLGKPPANPSEVMNALNKVKWLFTTLHNDYTLFQQTFSRAVNSGERAEVLSIIKDFLDHLSNRLNTRADPQRNGRQVFNQLPSNYIVEISKGDSFTDCWVTINRTEVINVGGQDTRRPDRASLSRMITDIRNFLKIINELYGKVGSRLTSDFRKLTSEAERNITKDGFDGRTLDTAITWFTEQQNRLFYRSMMLACATISAALDYCDAALRRNSVGNESLDEEEAGYPLTNTVALLNDRFSVDYSALGHASVGLSLIRASLESYGSSDGGVAALMDAPLDPLTYNCGSNVWTRFPGYNNKLGGYPSKVIEFVKAVDLELSAFADRSNEDLRNFLAVTPNSNHNVMTKHGYSDGDGYVQYLLADRATPTRASVIVAGADRSIDGVAVVLNAVRKRAEDVSATFSDTDILVSELYRVVSAANGDPISSPILNANWRVQCFAGNSPYGPVSIYNASMNKLEPYRGALPACDAEANVGIQEVLIKATNLDKDFVALWALINQMACRARSVQGALCDGMAKVNNGKVDQWLIEGVNYLQLLMTELRWQLRLLHHMIMYRYGVTIALCKYQRDGGL